TRDVWAALQRVRIAPALLVLELTESSLVDQDSEMSNTVRALNALGTRLSVDDFGTGYSSLSYLQRLSVHSVKVDRSFVAVLEDGPQQQALVRGIVDLAHSLELMVV